MSLARPHRALLAALGIYLVSRITLAVVVGFIGVLQPGMSLSRWLLRWDSGWFVGLVENGYPSQLPTIDGQVQQSTIAFFPAYPLLARVVGDVFGVDAVAGAAITSLALGFVTTVLLFVLVRRIAGEEVGLRAVALFWFFPGSVVLSMAYSEALMIPAALACLVLLQDRRWLLAGLAAIVVTASRSNGIAVVACCAWMAGLAIHHRNEWRSLVAPVLAPLGTIAFHLFLWHHTGDPRAWFRTQEQAWAEKIDFGARVVDRAWLTVTDPTEDLYSVVTTVGLLFALIGIVLMIRQRLSFELILFAGVMCSISLVSQTIGLRPRFLIAAFPILIAYAIWARGWRYPAFLGCSAMLLTMFTVMMSLSLELAP